MGVVYLARRSGQEHPVALKILYAQLSDDPECAARFRREAAVTAGLDHPNIVKLLDWGEDPEMGYYQVLDYVKGSSLRELLDEHPDGLDVPRALELTRELLAGLAYAHEQGVIHRDVKPENLLLTEDGRLHIADFGVARVSDGTKLTRTGLVPGTPAYMSPEQLGEGPVGPQTDVYAAGMVCYEMLTGSTPFASDNLAQVISRQIYQLPHPPSFGRPGLPEQLDAVVLKALEKKVEDRYPTAEAFRQALEQVKLQPSPPRAATSLEPVPRAVAPGPAPGRAHEPTLRVDLRAPARRAPAWLWMLPVCLLVAALALAWGIVRRASAEPAWYTRAIGTRPVPRGQQLLWGSTLYGVDFALFESTASLTAQERATAAADLLAERLQSNPPLGPAAVHCRRDGQDWSILVNGAERPLLRIHPSLAASLGAPPEAVARYWTALLQDMLRLRLGEQPHYLAENARLRPLRRHAPAIFPMLRTVFVRTRDFVPHGRPPTWRLMQAIDSLSGRDRQRLLEAAGSVPVAVPRKRP